jgi:hypothetical protein
MVERTKEHFWPRWLINSTNTASTAVKISKDKSVNPLTLTVPLCKMCNSDFGRELEAPVSQIFIDLESGNGISDYEAELLVRWLWKFEGLAWILHNPDGRYTDRSSLRDRVLKPIDGIRSRLTLAIALAETIDPGFGDAPMGIDSISKDNAIYVAGVFSRVAIMVLLRNFENVLPGQFSTYHFLQSDSPERSQKLFFPKTSFPYCRTAIGVTRQIALQLSMAHELYVHQGSSNG